MQTLENKGTTIENKFETLEDKIKYLESGLYVSKIPMMCCPKSSINSNNIANDTV